MRKFLIVAVLAGLTVEWVSASEKATVENQKKKSPLGVYFKRATDKVEVFVGGDPFTTYYFAGYNKPIFFPLRAASATVVTRGYPMVRDIPGEAQDHPHHKGLWLTHGNGVITTTVALNLFPAATKPESCDLITTGFRRMGRESWKRGEKYEYTILRMFVSWISTSSSRRSKILSSSVIPRKEHLELGSHNPLQKIRAVALKILVGALVKRTAGGSRRNGLTIPPRFRMRG